MYTNMTLERPGAREIWLAKQDGYNRIFLVLAARSKFATVIKLDKYDMSINKDIDEMVLGEDSGLRIPSIPNITCVGDFPIAELRHKIGEVDIDVYRTIVSCISDYYVGNIIYYPHLRGYSYKQSYDKKFRSESRKWVYDQWVYENDQEAYVDKNDVPDKVIVIEKDNSSTDNTVEDKKKVTRVNKTKVADTIIKEYTALKPVATPDTPIDEAVEKFMKEYSNGYEVDFAALSTANVYATSGKYPNKTGSKKRGRKPKGNLITLTREDCIYFLTHTAMESSVKYSISYGRASSVRSVLKASIYGVRKKISPFNPVKGKKFIDCTIDELLEANPDKSRSKCATYLAGLKCDRKVTGDTDPVFNYVFKFKQEDIERIERGELRIKSTRSKIDYIMDKYMYSLKDKYGDIILNIEKADILLTNEELWKKYNIDPSDEYANTFCDLVRRAFLLHAKVKALNLSEEEYTTVCEAKDVDKCIKILKKYTLSRTSIHASYDVAKTVDQFGFKKKYDLSAIGYDVLAVIRALDEEDTAPFSKLSKLTAQHCKEKLNIDPDQFTRLSSFFKSIDGKSRFLLCGMVKRFTNSELIYLSALHSNNIAFFNSSLAIRAIEDNFMDVKNRRSRTPYAYFDNFMENVYLKVSLFFKEEDYKKSNFEAIKQEELEYFREHGITTGKRHIAMTEEVLDEIIGTIRTV